MLTVEQRMRQFPEYDYAIPLQLLSDLAIIRLIELSHVFHQPPMIFLNKAYPDVFTFTKPVGSLVGAFIRGMFDVKAYRHVSRIVNKKRVLVTYYELDPCYNPLNLILGLLLLINGKVVKRS